MPKRSPRITIKRETLEWRMLKFLNKVEAIILNAWLPRQYPEAKLWRELLGLDKKKSWSEEEREKLKILASNTLTRLKAKGLVTITGSKKYATWVITPRGKEVFHYSMPAQEPLPEDGIVRVVTFDIPETHKADRNLIREQLINAGFVMLQKSVWIGKRPLPEYFFEMLTERQLFEYFHIFEIKETGTLQNLDWKNLDSQ
jgi:hypothetical protein